VNGGQPVEHRTLPEGLGRAAIDRRHPIERRTAALATGSGHSDDLVAGPEAIPPDQLVADVRVTGGGEVAGLAATEKRRAPGGQFEDTFGHAISAVVGNIKGGFRREMEFFEAVEKRRNPGCVRSGQERAEGRRSG
jgi:hypothetical protein